MHAQEITQVHCCIVALQEYEHYNMLYAIGIQSGQRHSLILHTAV